MKRPLKIVAWTLGVLAALIIIGIIVLQIFLPRDKIRALAIEEASAALKRPVDIKDVGLSVWGGLGVELDSVTIGNPQGFEGPPFLITDHIDVKLSLIPLLSKEFRVRRLLVDKPTLHMVKLADGTNNYTFARPTDTTLPAEARAVPPEGQAAAAAVSFDQLEIRGGLINFRNDSSEFSMVANNVDLSTDLDNPAEGKYASSGKLKIDSLAVTSKQPIPTVKAELNYSASYDKGKRHVVIERADFKFNEIELDLAGDFVHTAGAEHGKATLKAENVSIEQVLSLLPPQSVRELENFRVSGDFAVDMDVDYSAARAPALVYSGSAVFTDVNLARRDIVGELKVRRIVVDAKPDNIRLNVQDGSFDGRPLTANFVLTNFAAPQVNGELAGYLDFVFLKPFLPPSSAQTLAGLARFDFQFNGPIKDYKNMDFSGDITVEGGKYGAAFLPQPIDSFTLDAYFDQKLVNVRSFYGRTASAELQFQGRVENLIPHLLADSIAARQIPLNADGSIKGSVDLVMLQPFLPEAREPKLTGKMNIDLMVSGSTKDLENVRPRGRVSIVKAAYSDTVLPEPIQTLNAEFTLSPDTIGVERMEVEFVSSDAAFSGKLNDPFPYFLPLKTVDRYKLQKPFFQFRLSSRRFDSDKLFPEATPGAAGEAGPAGAAGGNVDTMPTLLLPDIDGAGTLAIDTLIYSRIQFTNLKGKARIENRRINIYDITGNAYTGQVAGQTTIDLSDFNNPRYSGEYNATQIEANDFVTRFTKFGGHLFGKVNIKGNYTAAGWEPEQFLQSLSSDGDATMQDGKLVIGENLYSGLQALSDKAGLQVDKEQALKALRSKIRVEDGKLILDKLTTGLSALGDLEVSGYYAFEGGISYEGNLLLSRELSQSFASKLGFVGGLLTDQKSQRMRLPLAITGSMGAPKLQFNFASLARPAQEGLRKEAEEKVKDAIGGALDKLTGGKK